MICHNWSSISPCGKGDSILLPELLDELDELLFCFLGGFLILGKSMNLSFIEPDNKLDFSISVIYCEYVFTRYTATSCWRRVRSTMLGLLILSAKE